VSLSVLLIIERNVFNLASVVSFKLPDEILFLLLQPFVIFVTLQLSIIEKGINKRRKFEKNILIKFPVGYF